MAGLIGSKAYNFLPFMWFWLLLFTFCQANRRAHTDLLATSGHLGRRRIGDARYVLFLKDVILKNILGISAAGSKKNTGHANLSRAVNPSEFRLLQQ
jgi:hypothetical protein